MFNRVAVAGLLATTGLAGGSYLSRAAERRSPDRGTLTVEVTGAASRRGHVIGKLFRRGDNVPKGTAFRLIRAPASGHVTLSWPRLAQGTYALFVFHDENDNGVPDHNWFGWPTETLGFSGGFSPSLWSGVPDFDDLKFVFSTQAPSLRIALK